MSHGFIVIPFGGDDLDRDELREMAATTQRALRLESPLSKFLGVDDTLASHFIDSPGHVEDIAHACRAEGHSWPDCEACP